MKLLTNIKPRRTGEVVVRDASGAPHEFKPDADGVLVCDVADTALVAWLLARGDDFEPYDEADFDAAANLVAQARGSGDGDDDGEDDDDDDQVDPNAPPVESNTPPAPAKVAAPARKTAKPRKAAAAS